MKKIILFSFVVMAIFATSCKKANPVGPDYTITSGVYVLNSGSWGYNNSTLVFYNPSTGNVTGDVFQAKNGKKLGDTANDLLIYGSMMYIAVNGSAVVFVTDLQGAIIKEITVAGSGSNLSPRQFAAADGKVYVTYQEGYLGEIDTTSLAIRTVQVGPFPEGILVDNGKIYTANSDGYNPSYGNTVSVLDKASFTVTKTINVDKNPQKFHKTKDGKVYLICWGNYYDVPASLMTLNTDTDVATKLKDFEPTNMAIGKYSAYVLSSWYDAYWNQTVKYFNFDTVSDSYLGEFVPSSAVTPNGYSIFADDLTGNVYIGASDFKSNGDMYVFSPEGKRLAKFDTGGINPVAVAFIRE
ncbi:MAG: hypothetical protein J6Z27_01910 [Bacteroidales bacterium]|nr:hypothetical protein [Bacteroidales bacterium]